jgi:cation diffusion facilitator family transporter
MDNRRNKAGKKAAIIAITTNFLLTILNITVGHLGGSYALIAEGMHTFSDVITSIIAFIGFKMGQKPADEDHPLGHGRAEPVAGLIIVLFLTIVGYEIIDTAKDKILNPSLIHVPDIYVAIMAVFGIIFNYAMSKYIIRIGKEINSPAIVADGQHQKTDIYSSVAIVIGVIVANSGFSILDPIIGMVIGLLILKTAFELAKENLNSILGKVPDKEIFKKIEKAAVEIPDVYEPHNIKVDNYGPYYIVNLNIKVDGNITVNEAHKLVSAVEKNILKIDNIKAVSAKACPLELDCNHHQK